MGKIKLVAIVIVCFTFLSPIMAKVSAEEIVIPITGWVYHMITSPVLPGDPDPQMSLADDLGPYGPTKWRFFRYDPELEDYVELKSGDWDTLKHDFDFGRGYWIISSTTRTIDIQGDPVGALNWITLTLGVDGWNQIGNIYLQDFTIGIFPNCNLWVTPENPDPISEPPYQLNDPLNPYTQVTLQEYAGGESYTDIGDDPADVLGVGKAYWLKNIYTRNLTLSFDPGGLPSVSTTNATNSPGQDFFARLVLQEAPPDPPPGIESSSSIPLSGSSGSGGGGCFIATAAYGNYDHPSVQILRAFRDQHLLANSLGRIFVDAYYCYSPALARFAAKHKSIKALTRFNLVPVIGMGTIVSKMNVYAYFAIMASPLLGGIFFLRRIQRVLERWKGKHSSKSKKGKRKG